MDIRRAVTRALPKQIEVLAALFPERTKTARRKKALAAYARLVGAMALARAVDEAELAGEILQAALASRLIGAG